MVLRLPKRVASERAAELLAGIARTAGGWYGLLNLGQLADVTAQQFKRGLPDDPEAPPYGLPWLEDRLRLRPVGRPRTLAWLNYWSDATAELVGWSLAKATMVFSSVERVDGGWLTRLTDDPFDVAKADDVRRVVFGYAQFPGVGRNL